jgi:predicted DNA repair protein MutK
MTSGFFAVLDDIVILMDDILTMTKVSAKKTAGILADDLAVNAEKSSGFSSSRELPVLWAITKGSFLNKLIILPVVFLLSAFLPSIILVVLVIGGIYLSFEGAEKIVDYFYPYEAVSNNLKTDFLSEQALLDLENKKIKSAVLTDFILSIEIIIIALGTVINESFEIKLIVVTLISMLATIGVYGVVGLIVRMDDLGYKLVQASKGRKNSLYFLGMGLVNALPVVIRFLSLVGTVALLLVSGGIFVHNIPFFHHFLENIPRALRDLIIGASVGFISVLLVKLFRKLLRFNRKV